METSTVAQGYGRAHDAGAYQYKSATYTAEVRNKLKGVSRWLQRRYLHTVEAVMCFARACGSRCVYTTNAKAATLADDKCVTETVPWLLA